MATPSTQIASCWAKTELSSVEWVSLREVCVAALLVKWTGKSEEEVLEYVEITLPRIAEHLRDEAASASMDGAAAKFEIDNEQTPYIRLVGTVAPSILQKLRKTDPFAIEEICARILQEFGASASVTQRTNDGGVDFVATGLNVVPGALLVPSGVRAIVIGQTKRYKEGNVINETKLREFVGAALLRKHVLAAEGKIGPLTPVICAFWTTSDFEPNAKKYARHVGLWFMDGYTMATYIESLGLGPYLDSLPEESRPDCVSGEQLPGA